MLAMIRINLVGGQPQKGGKRKRRAQLPDVPNLGVLIFVLLLVMEFAALYSWHAEASEAATSLATRARRAKSELDGLKKIAAEMAVVKKEIEELEKVAVVFDELDGEKRGPLGALTYLSFMFEPRDRGKTPTDELKQLEAAGWRTEWDARRAWIVSLREAEGEVTVVGEALNHEDVAEVLRRLESAAHFRNVQLVFNEKRKDTRLEEQIVQFTIKAALVYIIDPYLTAEQRQAEAEAKAIAAETAAKAAEGGAEPGQAVLPSDRAPPSAEDARDVVALAGQPTAAALAGLATPTAGLPVAATPAATAPASGAAVDQGAAAVPIVPVPAPVGGGR